MDDFHISEICTIFWISENEFLISENYFLISENDFLISENHRKFMISGNHFLISENLSYLAFHNSVFVIQEEYRQDLGASKLIHDRKEDVLMGRWRYPSLSLHGELLTAH